jgi:hypothetical protein
LAVLPSGHASVAGRVFPLGGDVAVDLQMGEGGRWHGLRPAPLVRPRATIERRVVRCQRG